MTEYSFTPEELRRIDAEMGEMYYDCPQCGFAERLGDLAKAVYNKNPSAVFRPNEKCAKCGHVVSPATRVKFGKAPFRSR
ncbi:MAG: hypothetical protein ACLQPD_19040 [Desulfomonilaceae bacterium]